jgi:enoyl-CoA hydratase/carnithine racemase
MDHVLFTREPPVGWLTLNHPQKRNALSLDMIAALDQAFDQAAADSELKVLVLQGNGPAFCAGHDLQQLAGRDKGLHDFRRIFASCARMMQKLHQVPQPVIAKVHGIATAAGCQLVAACDLAIAEDGARFATPGVKIGLFCSTPMTPLIRLIGRRRAMDMLMTGRFVPTEEAKSFGLVNKVAASQDLDSETRAWAMEIASASRMTLSLGKNTLYQQADMSESESYAYTQEVISMNCLTNDAQEGMQAFLEKREPAWKDS